MPLAISILENLQTNAQNGVLMGALIAGTLCGLIPLGAGARQNRIGLAISGFVACLVAGVFGGALFALPTGLVIKLFISVTQPRASKIEKLHYG